MNRLAVLALSILPATLVAQQAAPRFEVASVKPTESRTPLAAPIPRAMPGGQFRADITTVDGLLWFAYGVRQDLIVGGPDWVRKDTFEISAKANPDASVERIRLMVRSLLQDRFKLVTHMERREMQVLALVRARPDGPLSPNLISVDDCSFTAVNERRRKFPEKYPMPTGGGMIAGCSSMGDLAILLSTGTGTPVIDATGLAGNFHYVFRSEFSPGAAFSGRTNTDPNLPVLSTALEEHLGLKLQSRRGPVEVLVVDSVEQPTRN